MASHGAAQQARLFVWLSLQRRRCWGVKVREENTAMGLAFIQAQQKLQEKPVEAPTEKSIANRVFNHLIDEGVPLDVPTIAGQLDLDKQQVSVAIFQMKKVGYIRAISKPGSFLTYEPTPGIAEYGTIRKVNKRYKVTRRDVSQVVTEPVTVKKQVMVALPAPVGLKITVQTSEGPLALSVVQAKEVYQQLGGLFGTGSVSFDD